VWLYITSRVRFGRDVVFYIVCVTGGVGLKEIKEMILKAKRTGSSQRTKDKMKPVFGGRRPSVVQPQHSVLLAMASDGDGCTHGRHQGTGVHIKAA